MSEEWISAAEAYKLVVDAIGPYQAAQAICSRAHAGLIEAKAARFLQGREVFDDAVIPRKFWWADGNIALEKNWSAGDFETWVNEHNHWKAYGVSFRRAGITALVGPALANRQAASDQPANTGGRPAAAWWDDLWIEICRQLWAGELRPKKQSDLETAMMTWAAGQGHDPAESTIRARARKLWTALSKEDGN